MTTPWGWDGVSTRCLYGQHHLGVGLPFPIPGALLRIYPGNEGGLSVWVAVLDIPPREAGDWESVSNPSRNMKKGIGCWPGRDRDRGEGHPPSLWA